MWPDVVVVVAPQGQLAAGISQAVEDLFVEVFVAQAAVEALDIAFLLELSGGNVVPSTLLSLAQLGLPDLIAAGAEGGHLNRKASRTIGQPA